MSRARRALQIARGAAWAWRASVAARRGLAEGRALERLAVPPPPALPWPQGSRGIVAMLGRRRDTCLVRALVRQAWHASHGDPRDVVLGVRAPGDRVAAHAWLDGDEDAGAWLELARRPAAHMPRRPMT